MLAARALGVYPDGMSTRQILIALLAAAALAAFTDITDARQADRPGVDNRAERAVETIREHAAPLNDEADLDPLLNRIGDARLVLLGEATHGTSEFYTWRAKISRRLIEEKGFAFIVVEGDWTPCYRLNLYVKGLLDEATTAREIMAGFDRWPEWMWANEEVLELIEWLHEHNKSLPADERVGFYGLDIYGAPESKRQVLEYLEEADEEAAEIAMHSYSCMSAYAPDFSVYSRAMASGAASCEAGVVRVVETLRERADDLARQDSKAFFNAKQNAYTVKSAERHHRNAVRGGAMSWNDRARHFHATAVRLLEHHENRGGGVVWAHNTHIGDARATSMSAQGMLNIGHLARDSHGDDVVSVGFGMGGGELLAGRGWGDQVRTMTSAPPIPNSAEDLFRRAGVERGLIVFDDAMRDGPLSDIRGHRAIGVTFDPRHESQRNYVPTNLTRRYDAFIYFDETTPLRPVR
ncbi:MAG: erythromycin esterase family protein [Phycisphaeraceae bacterium]|nr:MAG: erythromycin esterase family protein [Phycisphaeraceae bacterium]